jgi:hypothetical protein
MSSNVLSDRDANTHLSTAKVEDLKPKSMEYHRQMLQSRMNDERSVAPALNKQSKPLLKVPST